MAEKFFWKDGRQRQLLPIDGKLPEVVSNLRNQQVAVVEAETGAGKTTRIPQTFLLEYPNLQIWMTQTRRNAVRWNGKRIAKEMGSVLGGVVGWRLFGDDPVVSRDTRLTLVIDQSLKNRIRESGGKLPKGLLIIDEAHERSVSTDPLLGLIKEALLDSPETKVLITSATIDTKKFSAFFGGAPVLSIQGRCYPVSTEVVRLTRYEHHSQGAARAASMVLERLAKNELLVPTKEGNGTQIVPQGTVLMLLPGKDDIASVMSSIQREATRLKLEDRVEILSCHGESSPEEQDAVQEPLRPGTLRFACGTEVLRSSVTVRETIGAIDSLQVKRLITDAKGVAHLDKIAISKAEAEQGRGRAGRTQPGFYMPVSFESEYENLQPYPMPAILREPITSVVLQVADVGRSVRNFAFIDAPVSEKVEVAITRLKRLGALDEQERITKIGEMLVQFPVDPERAKTLVTAHELGVLPETVVVTAGLETEGIFFSPNREKERCLVEEPILRRILSHVEKGRWGWDKIDKPRDPASVDLSDLPEWVEKKGSFWEVNTDEDGFPKSEGTRWVADLTRRYFAAGSKSDFAAIVRTYRAFKAEERKLREEPREERENGERRSREQQLREWCERWFVNYKRIRMAEDVMYQIREELTMSPLHLENGLAAERDFSAEALTKSLASGLIDHVLVKAEDRMGRLFKGPLGEVNLAYQSACPAGTTAVVVGGVRKIPVQGRRGSTSHILLADLAAPVKAEWLPEVMPQLCAATRKGDHHYDAERDSVVETEEIRFVDITVPQTVPSIDPEKCTWAFAQAGFQGFLSSEFGEMNRKNLQTLQEVESWHIRSGGKVKLASHDDMIAHYATVLYMHNVVSLATFRAAIAEAKLQKEDLILSLEDFVSKEKQEEILRDNPDRIMFLGSERQVQYQKGNNPPCIMLGENAEETETWKRLDSEDTEVRLPGGRLANVVVPTRGWSFNESNLALLKEKVRQHLNDYVWYGIEEATKPQITVPRSGEETFPQIIELLIGRDALTGEALHRFGVVIQNRDAYGRPSSYRAEWLGVREKAEKAHAEARTAFEEQKRQEQERTEKNEAIREARAMQERVGEVLSRDGIYDIESSLRSSLSSRRYDLFPSTASEIREWTGTTEAMIAEVEQAIIAAKRKKEEEERERQREEDRREAEKAKRRAKEEKFAETGVLVDEASTGFNSFAAALASAKRKQKR